MISPILVRCNPGAVLYLASHCLSTRAVFFVAATVALLFVAATVALICGNLRPCPITVAPYRCTIGATRLVNDCNGGDYTGKTAAYGTDICYPLGYIVVSLYG